MEKKFKIIGLVSIILIGTIAAVGFYIAYEDGFGETIEPSDNEERVFRKFVVGNHNFSSIAYGDVNNSYFRLDIGYRIVILGEEEGETVQVNITVLNRTEIIGTIETRVIEEREWEGGELIEVSYNYYALCNETNDVVYFGELSNEYEGGVITGTGGSWRADAVGAFPGIIMPGNFRVGDRYYQEYYPEVALDRAENIGMNAIFQTVLGLQKNCVIVEESNELEPPRVEYKVYAPGIGLIADETLMIVKQDYVTTGIN